MARALFQIARGVTTSSLSNGELYYNQTSQSLQLGSDSNSIITLAKLNETNSGSFKVSGDISASGNLFISGNARIVGNLTFGDSNALDTVTVVASLSSSLIPQTNNSFDLGNTTTYWKTAYITSITGSLSGSVNGTNITTFSASVSSSIGNLNNTSASHQLRIDALQQHSGSVNAFTASITSSYNATSQSLNSVSSSLFNVSGSYIATSQSVSNISTSVGLLETFSSSVISRVNSIENYTSSLKAAIELTGSSVTIQGDLLVRGTTTTINATTINLSASVIQVDAGGAVNGGIEVTDKIGASNITGSLLWDVSGDYWKAGKKGSEIQVGTTTDIYNLSMSVYSTATVQNENINTNSASAWGAYTSASSYSSSFYTTINNTTQSVLINSQSAWGAFQSASSYSGSFYTTINNTTQSVSTLSSSIGLLQTFSSSQYKNDSSSFDSRIDNLILGAGAQISDNNTFIGYNTFTQYITGSISGAVDGIDVKALSSSLNSRVIAATNEQYLSGFATTSSVEIISASAWGAFQSASSYSGSFYTTINNTTQSILINSQSAWGAFQSASSYSASFYTTINTNITNITAASASAWGAFQSASSYSSSFYTTINTNIGNITQASDSAWGAFQSASLYSSSLATSISASNYNITNNSSSFATSISASNAAATSYSASANTTYAKLGVENTFTQNQIISGSLNVTGDVVAYSTSDERLKDNIKLISNPIEKVQQLRGVEFDWNDKSMFKAGKHDYGVIAQDVEKVLPELVKESHTGYLGVDYDKIIGLLIEVVKEQEKRIKELENKVSY